MKRKSLPDLCLRAFPTRRFALILQCLFAMNVVFSSEVPVTEKTGSDHGPRKVIVGTSIFSVFDRPYVSVDQRLSEVSVRVGEMSADARKKFGRGLDVAVLPENTLNRRGRGIPLWDRAVAFDESVRSSLGRIARENGTYLVVSFNLREEGDEKAVSNVAVLFNRAGELEGIYRKAFLVPDAKGELEGGKIPGADFPVFDTDFGRVAIAICFDMGFDELFESYAEQGVELVLWPTMSPQTFLPRSYARRFGYYIVSATPRDNASVFDPMGEIAAQTQLEGPLTAEIDLNYELVHWFDGLDGGQSLKEKFGDRVGFRYSYTEDTGIFWSNDPSLSIREMLDAIGVPSFPTLRKAARDKRAKQLSPDLTND